VVQSLTWASERLQVLEVNQGEGRKLTRRKVDPELTRQGSCVLVNRQDHFAVTEKAISSVLLQEQDQVQNPIYFVSKVLQGSEVRYQALEKAALVVVFSAQRLCISRALPR